MKSSIRMCLYFIKYSWAHRLWFDEIKEDFYLFELCLYLKSGLGKQRDVHEGDVQE